MRKIITITLLLIFAKSSFCQEIEIIRDTIEINLNRSLGPWIVYKDKFYCFFEKDNDYYSGYSGEFYVFNRKGEVLKKTLPPWSIRTYYDLFIKNDTVFVLDYYDHYTYYINEDFEFIETKRVDDLIYQDSSYYVTSIDHGEWGGTTWFINKQDKNEYELSISTPLINKYNGKYILTCRKHIYEIYNPTDLKQCIAPRDYSTAFQTGKRIDTTTYLQGIHTVYADSNNGWDSKFYIATSTMINNKLYHLCVDNNFSYLANLEDGKLKTVFSFEKGLTPFRRYDHDRNRIIDNSYQSIQFTTSDDNLFGIIEFKGNRIVQTYFHNIYKTPILGTENSKQLFIDMFDYYVKNNNSLTLDDVDSIETKLQAYDITQKHYIGYSLKKNLHLETPRIYRKVEDSSIVLLTEYYYTSKGNKVEIITFKWKENTLFDKNLFYFSEQEFQKQILLAEKIDWVKDIITSKMGKANNDVKLKKIRDINWKKNGIIINLHGNFLFGPNYCNSIELTFYKK